MKKVRLVTAAFGDLRESLRIKAPLIYQDYQIDIICYNNYNTSSRTNSLHPRLKGKIPKMMEWVDYPDYDYYIWIDSRFTILKDFMQLLFSGGVENTEIFLFSHPTRISIKEEFEFMSRHMSDRDSFLFDYLNSRYKGERIDEQVRLYLTDPNFKDNLLFSLGCFMFTKELVKNRDYNLMTDWFLHNVMYSIQDQLSFPYLLQKHKTRYKIYSENLMSNIFLDYD